MRIVFVNPSYPPMACGIGGYTRELARTLTAEGHTVTVLTSSQGGIAEDRSPDVLPVLRDWTVSQYLAHLPLLRRLRPDVVVGQYPALNPGRYARLLYLLPGLVKLTLPRTRVIYVVHEFGTTEESGRRLLELALRAADRVVTVTEGERDAVAARHPFTRSKLDVVPLGPNIHRVEATAEELRAVRAAQGLEDRPVVFYFGLIRSPAKGFGELLDAIAALGDTGAVLVASGKLHDDDPYEQELAARIEAEGLADRVRWLGYLDDADAARWFQAADAVALPFHGGAAAKNTTLVGALVNGAAVVTTTGPDTPSYLRDGDTALLVEPRDAGALTAALRRILESPDLRGRLRAGAAGLAARFEWPRIADAVIGTR